MIIFLSVTLTIKKFVNRFNEKIKQILGKPFKEGVVPKELVTG